ncbi:MAG: sensor histidine kinase [Oscillibacter sp.]|nr:sensor histidine kinase [Oscillibacter sp.]
MEKDHLTALFPQVAAQLRYALSNLHMAASALAPVQAREGDAQLDQRAAMLDQSFYQMLRLVNQLSAAVYLTSEEPLPLRNRDVGELVAELCAQAESLAACRGLHFRLEDQLGHHVCAVAADAVEQGLFNLLSNAFKFTPAGGTVTVTLRRKGKYLHLSVADTGCGIEPERMEHIFESFAHLDPMQPPPHGLGLGLALCRRFAEGQGGALLARSVPGEGSVFTLSLPDRTVAESLHDLPVDYAGGFNRALLGLADALPAKAFRVRESD